MSSKAERVAALGYDYVSREKENIVQCNLCGSSHFTTISRTDRYGFPAHSQICLGCGLGFLNPRLTAEEYTHFYIEVYRPLVSAYYGRLIDEKSIQADQADYGDYVWESLKHGVKESGSYTMLDVGGSTGVVAQRICELAASEFDAAVKATILDPAPLEIEEAQKLGIETVTGFMEDFDPGERRWDFVIMCQTVDHLADISGTLAKIREVMTPNGLFFIDIVDWEFALHSKGYIEDAVKIDHPYMITRAAMCQYFDKLGFEIINESISPSGHLVGFLCRSANLGRFDRETGQKSAQNIYSFVRSLQARPFNQA